MWRDDARLQDMRVSARLIMEYVQGMERKQFLADVGTQHKVLRRLTILGEAAKNVSEARRAGRPDVPWREIAGLRDVVVHRYPTVRMERIWQIVQENIPPLLAALEQMIPEED